MPRNFASPRQSSTFLAISWPCGGHFLQHIAHRWTRRRSWSCARPPGPILSNRISPSCLGEPILNRPPGQLRGFRSSSTRLRLAEIVRQPAQHVRSIVMPARAPYRPAPSPAAVPASHRRGAALGDSRGRSAVLKPQGEVGVLGGVGGRLVQRTPAKLFCACRLPTRSSALIGLAPATVRRARRPCRDRAGRPPARRTSASCRRSASRDPVTRQHRASYLTLWPILRIPGFEDRLQRAITGDGGPIGSGRCAELGAGIAPFRPLRPHARPGCSRPRPALRPARCPRTRHGDEDGDIGLARRRRPGRAVARARRASRSIEVATRSAAAFVPLRRWRRRPGVAGRSVRQSLARAARAGAARTLRQRTCAIRRRREERDQPVRRSRFGGRLQRLVWRASAAASVGVEQHQPSGNPRLFGEIDQGLAPLVLLDLAGAGQERVEIAVFAISAPRS